MTHTSPASFLIWTCLTGFLAAFLVFHLWSFDRFKCLRWNNGPYNGAFKRIMTYSYMISIPMIFVYASGNAIIKYREGFITLPPFGIIPKPYELWGKVEQRSVFPLMTLFSVAWSLEMVTHLEELCFWLFLVNSGSSQQDWFSSPYFRTWSVGSVVAVIYMPLVTILTRSDPLKSEAYTFLAGSIGSLSLTVWFVPILWTFPGFLKNLRREGVDIGTIVRLTKFSELNTIRVVFRFLFTVPLLVLGIDGVRPHNHINESMFWTDFLVILAGFGCSVSSAITLVIFFPRSIEGEIAAADAKRDRRRIRAHGLDTMNANPASQPEVRHFETHHERVVSPGGTYLLTSSPVKQNFGSVSLDNTTEEQKYLGEPRGWEEEERDIPRELRPQRSNRKKAWDVEMSDRGSLTESNLTMHEMQYRNVNHMVSNFTSPIDFTYQSGTPAALGTDNNSRLTFSKK